MAPMDVIWQFLVSTYPLPTTSWLPTHPAPSHPIEVLVTLVKLAKSYLKWQAFQLAIHSIADE